MLILVLFYSLQASENLGMAMIYTLVTSAKEWLSERFGQDSNIENAEAAEAEKEDVWFFINHLYLTYCGCYVLLKFLYLIFKM